MAKSRSAPMGRRSFLEQSVAGIFAAGAGFGSRPYHTDHPGRNVSYDERPANVVLLMSDQHNPFYTSIMGHPLVRTPNLERLAARGTVFENAYCPSPLCMPCRSAFMSGRRVHDIQCYNNCNVFSFDYPTYGQILREAGVHTVHIGKTDVFRPGAALGFSEIVKPGDRKPPGDTFSRRNPLAIRSGAAGRASGWGPSDGNPFARDEETVNAAIEWLGTTARTVESPWVLVVQVVKPHFPLRTTPELWEMYRGGDELPKYRGDAASANHPYALDLRAHFETDQFTEEQVRGLRRGYLGCVTHVDRQLGRLLDTLDQHGLTDDTVIMYTSDHGEMLGKFDMWWKSSLYEDSARVPLVAAGRGFKKGARVRTPVDLHDVRAGVFHAVRRRQPSGWLGEAPQTLTRDNDRRIVFSEYHGHGVRSSGYLVRKGDWKLIYCAAAPHLLFNLAEDPDELTNLAGKHPKKLKELERELREICSPEQENDRAEQFIEKQLAAIPQEMMAVSEG